MLSAEHPVSRATVPARWLPLVRLAWLASAGAAVTVFATRFATRSALLIGAPAYSPGLAALGVSPEDLRRAVAVLDVCTALAFSAVALLMFWRKSDEWIGLLASLALLTFGTMPSFLRYARRGMWDSADAAMLALGTALAIGVLCIFPNGRFYPRWSKLLTALVCAWALTWPFLPRLNPYNWGELAGAVITALYVAGMAALLYRYRRTGRGPQRQQIKWVIYAIALQVLLWVLVVIALFAWRGSLARQAYSLATLLGGSLIALAQLLVPLAFVIAILRYKLWDIDLIITRTLIYVPLTGILAGVYAASTASLGKLGQAFTGQKSDAAVVLTTLLIVAIFSPVKDALQHAVERRYRERRDPLAAVENLGSEVRHVIDVFDAERISQRALATAATALRARSGAIYQEQDGQRRLVHAYGPWGTAEAVLEIPIEARGVRLGCLKLAPRQDGAPYNARDQAVLRSTLAEVGLAIYLASIRHQLAYPLDE